jgi:hypothetical protein
MKILSGTFIITKASIWTSLRHLNQTSKGYIAERISEEIAENTKK